jgi:hypothetical protein
MYTPGYIKTTDQGKKQQFFNPKEWSVLTSRMHGNAIPQFFCPSRAS